MSNATDDRGFIEECHRRSAPLDAGAAADHQSAPVSKAFAAEAVSHKPGFGAGVTPPGRDEAPERGVAQPLGATVTPIGVNFSVYSEHATGVTLLLFDSHEARKPTREVTLTARNNRSFHFWHCHLSGVGPGQVYAYRMDGPFEPSSGGLRFNRNKVLIDPNAFGHIDNLWDRETAVGPEDNVATSMRSVVSWHGSDLGEPDWHDPGSAVLSFTLAGLEGADDVHVILNMSSQGIDFALPGIGGRRWARALDTTLASPDDIVDPGEEVVVESEKYHAGERSVVALISQEVQS